MSSGVASDPKDSNSFFLYYFIYEYEEKYEEKAFSKILYKFIYETEIVTFEKLLAIFEMPMLRLRAGEKIKRK